MKCICRLSVVPLDLWAKHSCIRRSYVGVLALVTAVVFAPIPCRADSINLLLNPGFESGDFSGWTVSGTSVQFGVATDGTPIMNTFPSFAPTFQNVRTGQFAANALLASFAVPQEGIILQQTIPVPMGHLVLVGFWIGTDAQRGFGMGLGDGGTQIFIDGVGILPNRELQFEPGSSPQDFALVGGTFNTGTRTTVDVAFNITGSGTGRVGASLDDFFVQPRPVPEPSSILLLASGLVGAVRWRARARKSGC
jgi:PEP-CTERM motif-containing protein